MEDVLLMKLDIVLMKLLEISLLLEEPDIYIILRCIITIMEKMDAKFEAISRG